MRTHLSRSLPLILPGLLLLTGCETWQAGGKDYTSSKGDLTLNVPAGWNFTLLGGTDLTATKEGLPLHRMTVEHLDIKDPLPHSKRTVTPQMSAFEVAEAVLDDLRSDHDMLNFEVAENTPFDLGGRPGFRLVLNYRNAEKLRLSELRYGCLAGSKVYFLRYVAPTRYYFERDRAEVEETAKTFRVLKN